MFDRWQRLGRPITAARPVSDLVAQLRAAFPHSAFSWAANDAHYAANPPEDHTPYSVDAWPIHPNPEWVVFALDIMVAAVGGVDRAQRIFDHLLADAKAGRAPWIKYLIWRATIYDVRFGWRPQTSSGHFDHIHLSARTDYEHHALGGWSIQPERSDMEVSDLWNANTASRAHPVTFIDRFNQTAADAAASRAEATAAHAAVAALSAVITQLSAAIAAGGGTVDTTAILAGVDQRLAALRTEVEADTRDAIGDLAAGGEQAVRADQ